MTPLNQSPLFLNNGQLAGHFRITYMHPATQSISQRTGQPYRRQIVSLALLDPSTHEATGHTLSASTIDDQTVSMLDTCHLGDDIQADIQFQVQVRGDYANQYINIQNAIKL